MLRRKDRSAAKPRGADTDYHLRWVACVELEMCGHFYTVADEDLENIPASGTGVYLFCRRHGQNLSPQYVGRSRRLRKRIREHLERVSLVKALAAGETGRRVVLVAIVEPRRGQSAGRVAQEVEGLLIRRFRAASFDLLNEKGNRRRQRFVRWHGGRAYKGLVPRLIQL
jgi:hypothetical protein